MPSYWMMLHIVLGQLGIIESQVRRKNLSWDNFPNRLASGPCSWLSNNGGEHSLLLVVIFLANHPESSKKAGSVSQQEQDGNLLTSMILDSFLPSYSCPALVYGQISFNNRPWYKSVNEIKIFSHNYIFSAQQKKTV